jgi:hypothetical protein
MPAKPKPRLTIADSVYKAIHDVDGGTETALLNRASKIYGKRLNRAQLSRALTAINYLGFKKG